MIVSTVLDVDFHRRIPRPTKDIIHQSACQGMMGATPYILHVGISPDDQSSIEAAIEQSGTTVETLEQPDAESALAFLEDTERSPDSIVSTYDLPGMDGIEFKREQHSRSRESAVPFVLFVEEGSESIAASALNAGISGYIRRNQPDSIGQLADCVRSEIGAPPSRDDAAVGSLHGSCREELRWERERLEEVRRVLSHDLRSPLNVAKGFMQYVSPETGQSDTEGDDSDETISKIITALDRIELFLEELNTLIEQGGPVQSADTVKLTDVARSAWNDTSTERAQLRLVDDEPPVSGEIIADSERVLGLLRELYRNAIDHGSADVTVEIGPLDDGFYVMDSGSGIPENKRESVLLAGVSDRRDRTGIGLARVKHIAGAHGWDVSVRGGNQGGSRFEITGVEYAPGEKS